MKLKLALSNRVLNRKLAKVSRNIKVHNLNTAKTVGVLWSFDEKDAFLIVQQHIKSRKNLNLEALYFNQEKEAANQNEHSFGKADLSWLGFPKQGLSISFIQKEWDVLIDLSVKKKFPIKALATLSKAVFKVGYSPETNNPYDLNIDIHQNPNPNYLAEQIIKYLNKNKKKESW